MRNPVLKFSPHSAEQNKTAEGTMRECIYRPRFRVITWTERLSGRLNSGDAAELFLTFTARLRLLINGL